MNDRLHSFDCTCRRCRPGHAVVRRLVFGLMLLAVILTLLATTFGELHP